jgi:hypothetical protein
MAELGVVDLSGETPQPDGPTVTIRTRAGQSLDLAPRWASSRLGPTLTITDAEGATATAVIDSTTWATLRGYLAAET